jgi:hypothetical protein
LRGEEAEVTVPPSVPVRVAYELQLAGHRYLDVRYMINHAQFNKSPAPIVLYMIVLIVLAYHELIA